MTVSPSPRSGAGGLLERDRELAAADELVRATELDTGRVLALVAPPGLGKTALLRCWGDAVRASGRAVWRATGDDLGGAVPFGLLREALGRPVAALPPAVREALLDGPARLAVEVVLDRQPAGPADPGRAAHSFFWLVDALTETTPAVLLADDVQWADEASLHVIGSWCDRLDDLRLSVALAARETAPSGRSPALARILGHERTRVLRPQPLSGPATRALVAEITGHEVGDDVAEACASVTDGNPFLVSELAAMLGDADADAVAVLVPESVVDTVVRRLAGLGAEAQALAHAVAVLGSAPLRLVAGLAGTDPATASDVVPTLRDAGLIASGTPLAYRHALLRSAVLDTLGPERLAGLRRQAARLWAQEPDGEAQAAAHLLLTEGVGDPGAVRSLLAAGRHAVEQGASAEAVALLRRALHEPPAPDAQPELRLRLGQAQLRAGDPECVGTLRAAIAGLADPALRAEGALTLVQVFNFGGAYEESVTLLEAALADVEPDSSLALTVESGLIEAALQVPRLVEGARRRLWSRAGVTGERAGERLVLSQLAAVGNATSAPVEDVVEAARSAIGHAGDLHPEAHQWTLVRLQLAATGQYAETLELCRHGRATVARDGSAIGFVAVSFVSGFAALWSGRLPDAEADFRACLDVVSTIPGGEIARAIALAGLVETLCARGHLAEAVELAALDEPVDESSFNGSINLLRARALVRHATGDHVGALVDLAGCRARQERILLDNPPWCAWRSAEIAVRHALGEEDEAHRLLVAERGQAAARRDPIQAGVALRIAAQVSGEVAPLQESVELLSGTEAALELARSHVALGALLRRQGRRAEARDWLLRGRAGAARCEADGLREYAEGELAAAGSRPRRLEVSGIAALTASERRVCELAASGLRNKQIAQQLFLSTKTVEVHLTRSFRKLGAQGREDLPRLLLAGAWEAAAEDGVRNKSAVGEQSRTSRGTVDPGG